MLSAGIYSGKLEARVGALYRTFNGQWCALIAERDSDNAELFDICTTLSLILESFAPVELSFLDHLELLPGGEHSQAVPPGSSAHAQAVSSGSSPAVSSGSSARSAAPTAPAGHLDGVYVYDCVFGGSWCTYGRFI